jgi:hypothetical protein
LRPLAKAALAPYYRMTNYAFRRASGIVGISESYLDWGLKCAGRSRGPQDALLPLGYWKPELTDTALADGREYLRGLGIDESRLVCWFLGSFGDTYDLEPVILAARELKARGLNKYQFILSGEGEGRARYEQLAAGLDNVVFSGWLNANQIASMMQVAQVGMAAYRKGAPQGLPNKIFEYMAGGLPILSSLAGECRQFLEANGCGLSYPAGSAVSFLDALLNLTNDATLLNRLGANALKNFNERYSASVIYAQAAEYLRECALRPQRPGYARAAQACA